MSAINYDKHPYRLEARDIYVVRPYDPQHIHRPFILTAGQNVILATQKYHYDVNYVPCFRRDIALNFHIGTCNHPDSPHKLFPTVLTGYIRSPLPTERSIDARLDEFIRELTEFSALIIHYNDEYHLGCIVHPDFHSSLIQSGQLEQVFRATSQRFYTKPILQPTDDVSASSADQPTDTSTPST